MKRTEGTPPKKKPAIEAFKVRSTRTSTTHSHSPETEGEESEGGRASYEPRITLEKSVFKPCMKHSIDKLYIDDSWYGHMCYDAIFRPRENITRCSWEKMKVKKCETMWTTVRMRPCQSELWHTLPLYFTTWGKRGNGWSVALYLLSSVKVYVSFSCSRLKPFWTQCPNLFDPIKRML